MSDKVSPSDFVRIVTSAAQKRLRKEFGESATVEAIPTDPGNIAKVTAVIQGRSVSIGYIVPHTNAPFLDVMSGDEQRDIFRRLGRSLADKLASAFEAL